MMVMSYKTFQKTLWRTFGRSYSMAVEVDNSLLQNEMLETKNWHVRS